ncbi:hypothetical protein D9M69_491130 [compost metagenome]
MTTSILMGLDAVLCILVVLAALEFQRTVHVFEHPILSLSFYIVAIGAFGILTELARGYWISPFSVLLHLGVVMYAWARRGHIFRDDWSWTGKERRHH